MLNTEDYRKIYSMLDTVSPLPFDCGSLCGSICCSDEPFSGYSDSYIYLLPGEKEFLDLAGHELIIEKQPVSEHYLPSSWGEYVYIARCPGKDHCRRQLRPIQCRSFPLEPHLGKRGRLELIYCDLDLPYSCSLISEKKELSDDFVRVTYEAWKLLMEDKAIRDLIKLDSANRRSKDLCIVYRGP